MRVTFVIGEAGAGDTLARMLSKVGGNRYKAWRKRIGKPCNCAKRQAALNKLFTYHASRTSVISDTSVASQTANNESLDSVRD